MAKQLKPFLFRASDGGGLFTNPSHEAVGANNWVTRRNWRRQDNFDQVREGHDYLWINTSGDFASHPGVQPTPNLVTEKTGGTAAYAGGVVTVTFNTDHDFVVGELVEVDAGPEEGYAGEATVTATTRLTLSFVPAVAPSIQTASGTASVRSKEPINLVAECRRPNGQMALVVGTKVRLFRFYPNNGDPYAVTDYWVDGYTDDATAGWVQIGGGYSVNGNRWEAADLNGYLILNNGVDLPVTYRVEDNQVYPIYELRESEVASVGTITSFNEVLCCFDVRQFKPTEFLTWMTPIGTDLFQGVTASQSGTTVSASSLVFSASDVGKFIVFADGDSTEITAFTDAQNVTVADSFTKSDQEFSLKIKGSQSGAYFSLNDSGKTATLSHATMQITMSAAPATAGIVGDIVRFANGFQSEITSVDSTTQYTLTIADSPGVDFMAQVFWIVKSGDNEVVADVDLFTDDMTGRQLYFSNGEVRTIVAYNSPTSVTVDSDSTVSSSFISVENPNAYGAVESDSVVDRIQWRWLWGEIEEPRRFGAAINCETTAGSDRVTLDYPALSLAVGDEVTVLGAGLDGGNLNGTILQIAGNRYLTLDVTAELAVKTTLQRSDSIGGTTGFTDLQDDGSGILKAAPLQDTLVIYKDTSIFLANYTGVAASPFTVRRRLIPPNTGLYFRHTLITFEENVHIYAGRQRFYQFDLTNQVPIVFKPLEGCRSVFFDGARRANTELIFASDNAITKETWFHFPHGTTDSALILDQIYGAPSTSDRGYTAAATIVRPTSDEVSGESDSMFICAKGEVVLVYGKTDSTYVPWSGVERFSLRDQYPIALDEREYDAVMESGLEAFNDPDMEKDVTDYTLMLSSWSTDTPIRVALLAASNPTNNPTEQDSLLIDQPEEYNQMPTLIRNNFFADRVSLKVFGEKVSISARQYRARSVGSRGIRRAPGDF